MIYYSELLFRGKSKEMKFDDTQAEDILCSSNIALVVESPHTEILNTGIVLFCDSGFAVSKAL